MVESYPSTSAAFFLHNSKRRLQCSLVKESWSHGRYDKTQKF